MCGSSRHCYESQSASCKAICICVARLETARQIFNSSTLLDSSTARQNSTDLDTPAAGTCSQPRLRLASTGSTTTRQLLDSYSTATRQLLDSYSTATRQLLDSYSTGSTGKALTAPRQRPRQRLDGALTARQLDSQGSTRDSTTPMPPRSPSGR